MIDKFTYFDFQMYILPGAWTAGMLLAFLITTNMIDIKAMNLDLFGSVLFILLSFIFGHLIQGLAHGKPEERLKKKYWNGLFPSQIMFFPENKIINETMRKKYLNSCMNKKLLTEKELTECNANSYDNKILLASLTTAFQATWIKHQGDPKANRIAIAEAHYQFFRGMFVSAFWTSMLFLTPFVYWGILYLIDIIINNFINMPVYSYKTIIILIIGFTVNITLWKFFKDRCKGTGQGFAREVVRAELSNYDL